MRENICGLFNDAVINSGCIAPNKWMLVNNEMKRMWKEPAVLFKVRLISRNVLEG
jgi:hypothetical protein